MAGIGVAVGTGVAVGAGVSVVVAEGVGSGEAVGSGVGVTVGDGDGVGVGVGLGVGSRGGEGDGDSSGAAETADETFATPLADAGTADVRPAAPSTSRRAVVAAARGRFPRHRRLGFVRVPAINHSCWHRDAAGR
jgi:hypothetical protein